MIIRAAFWTLCRTLPVTRMVQAGVTWILMAGAVSGEPSSDSAISFSRDIQPILQANCLGCHQPAKAGGGFVMTDFARLLQGGESGPAIVPNHPEDSLLMKQVTPEDGVATMPPEDAGEPLSAEDREAIRKWIGEGAQDDSPEFTGPVFDAEHPPHYQVPPVITTLDFSPDGKLLAVSGFHEVLLYDVPGERLAARLVGLSDRIERLRFSPDGKRLAVAAGIPARSGEIQIWDLESKELLVSKTIGSDTAYGASWSPDGSLVAFGGSDNTVRALDAETGAQKLFMLSHSDWVLDTAFSPKGEFIVSVGRDMSVKLTRVETQQFIDNITSITPGALKGGVHAVVPHPTRDEILVGGADGVPQVYRLQRETARRIGDNANLVRRMDPVTGRIWCVAYSPDGKKAACCSSLDGKGWVDLYSADFDPAIPDAVRVAFEKVASGRSPDEQKLVDDYHIQGVTRLHSVPFDESAIFAIDFHPDGQTVAAAGSDGQVRLIDVATGNVVRQFSPAPIEPSGTAPALAAALSSQDAIDHKKGKAADLVESKVDLASVQSVELTPSQVSLTGPFSYAQLLATATLTDGSKVDVTRQISWEYDRDALAVSARGEIRPIADGTWLMRSQLGAALVTVEVTTQNMTTTPHPDLVQDVIPVISRLGCNAGTCHGAKEGKNGFKLSLRGYDPIFDLRAFTEDHASRRVNVAFPDDSLMMLKSTGAVPHVGGMVTERDSHYYRLLRQWIADGARSGVGSKPVRIELSPANPIVSDADSQQQFRVVALDAAGARRDVTREAIIESGNADVALHDDFGLITAVRRGEAPVLARYEGCYAATTLTVMGDRQAFAWEEPETWGTIDELVRDKWKRLQIRPAPLCSDAEFLRRVHLDLTGLPPTSQDVRAFLADGRPTRVKRDERVAALIGSPAFVDHWTNKWADLLQINSKFLGEEGARAFREWTRTQIEQNRPYNQFVFDLLTASGSTHDHPAASYYKILRTPAALVENTTHLFLATRFNCNKCHDHPFERWTQDQYYQTGAYFAQIARTSDAEHSGNRVVDGTDVEGATPLFEVIEDAGSGEFAHERTGAMTPPAFPFECQHDCAESASRRTQLATWLTSPDNPYFALSYVNRLWGYLLGRGIIEPLDDIRAGNPPSNPELLAYLRDELIRSGFDVRHVLKQICQSRTYQLSIETNPWNEDDRQNFSHALARRLAAEDLFDTIHAVTGVTPAIPHVDPGTRASQLFDARIDLDSGLLATLGRPPRESACECERTNEIHLGSVMALLNGPAIAQAINDPRNDIGKLVESTSDDRQLIDEIFVRVLNRPPTEAEVAKTLESWAAIEPDHQALVKSLAQAEADWTIRSAKFSQDRFERILAARRQLEQFQPIHAARRAELEQAQQARIAQASQALEEYRAKLPELVRDWESKLPVAALWTRWRPLSPEQFEASGGITLTKTPDGQYLAAGPLVATGYHLWLELPSVRLSGLGIEALPHDDLPGLGSGLNPDGNFAVSEVQVAWQPKDTPQENPLAISAARADYNQEGFDIAKTFNGKVDRDDAAWAVGGSPLHRHFARFQLAQPLASDTPGTLHVRILCEFGNSDYPLASFRLYTTEGTQPLEEGLPTDIAEIVLRPAAERSPEQLAALAAHLSVRDTELVTRRQTLARENRPLAPDTERLALEAALAQAERPVPDDPALTRLRADVALSIEQVSQRRLTAAQDLTWALINNAEFLFNH